MRVHHINCGTMHPRRTPDGLVCHVIVVETDNGLVLVDSGFGLQDAVDPKNRFGPARFYVRPIFDPEETALRQLPRLGLDPADVRHIVLTHFDADHVGGLSDFPDAHVHLTTAEATAALHPLTATEKRRYLPALRAHHPRLTEHSSLRTDTWKGFAGATELTDISPGIVLVNLPGHSRGHAGVAVDAGDRWILHAGDSFYHHGQVDGTVTPPLALRMMERIIAQDWERVQANHQRLEEIWTANDPNLVLVNAHDPTLLKTAQLRNGH
ncbi:MBL fold metallo-hydrolase [Rhodococcus sp. NPDC056743]|uniref:MBL fold metallo-hydrolase n=1 Tax=Rhodococcus sp. NPDC056743 TaxID=3345934 RepID=UPI0036707AAB